MNAFLPPPPTRTLKAPETHASLTREYLVALDEKKQVENKIDFLIKDIDESIDEKQTHLNVLREFEVQKRHLRSSSVPVVSLSVYRETLELIGHYQDQLEASNSTLNDKEAALVQNRQYHKSIEATILYLQRQLSQYGKLVVGKFR